MQTAVWAAGQQECVHCAIHKQPVGEPALNWESQPSAWGGAGGAADEKVGVLSDPILTATAQMLQSPALNILFQMMVAACASHLMKSKAAWLRGQKLKTHSVRV